MAKAHGKAGCKGSAWVNKGAPSAAFRRGNKAALERQSILMQDHARAKVGLSFVKALQLSAPRIIHHTYIHTHIHTYIHCVPINTYRHTGINRHNHIHVHTQTHRSRCMYRAANCMPVGKKFKIAS